jgi:hypothetical protein
MPGFNLSLHVPGLALCFSGLFHESALILTDTSLLVLPDKEILIFTLTDFRLLSGNIFTD